MAAALYSAALAASASEQTTSVLVATEAHTSFCMPPASATLILSSSAAPSLSTPPAKAPRLPLAALPPFHHAKSQATPTIPGLGCLSSAQEACTTAAQQSPSLPLLLPLPQLGSSPPALSSHPHAATAESHEARSLLFHLPIHPPLLFRILCLNFRSSSSCHPSLFHLSSLSCLLCPPKLRPPNLLLQLLHPPNQALNHLFIRRLHYLLILLFCASAIH
ncbi:uncharacterized protein MONOS_15388 [Monocercomonoides exilis]|uniref:uncharacterized protein n=1 Tax=Monocercomonoides exilis TaxID=2049356 RepID=UPI00355AB63C|nr:hypothetical protein MONOS_15388 [Monocercomonoides exilis]|eukprot:MONOS_15388.1-p1 / transcript=MONOS_15388.1 / gene=MONOS_15388 / organism=Monocercomonoides_exilis_PA203 / gene_product=unspecified product / transcript_product=unspecified product / location=Mono_scaffold01216:835-1491(+) / protein_length=219 / sequence_SO=supercontig / SO=protein_coding / is_pseudo=false